MNELKGKVAVVTGGSRDIGKAISIKLAKEGARVVVNYHNSEAGAKETVAEIKSFGGEAIAVKADISNLADIKSLKAKVVEAVGEKIDIVVNNAAVILQHPIAEMDYEGWQKVWAETIAVNLQAAD